MKKKKMGKLNTKPKSVPVQDEEELTSEEQEALAEIAVQDEEEAKKVSFKKMEKAVALLEEEFNLKDKSFSVTSFTDKGNTVKVSMTNGSFDITVCINDAEVHCITSD